MLDTTILSSTFLLTILMVVGLVFFIRASVKDRSQQLQLIAPFSEESYFLKRAYGLDKTDRNSQLVTFKGFVRPSWFLSIFLSTLAACGLACLGLILGFLYPPIGNWFLLIILLAPLAGVFYWRRAGRIEYVSLKVEPLADTAGQPQTLVTLIGHRDELAILQQSLQLRSPD
jgi:hypothetical protein